MLVLLTRRLKRLPIDMFTFSRILSKLSTMQSLTYLTFQQNMITYLVSVMPGSCAVMLHSIQRLAVTESVITDASFWLTTVT